MNEQKRERRRRIKDQNAERKNNPLWKPREELTPEQRDAIRHIAIGLMELFVASVPQRNEFPSELEIEEVEP